MLVIFFSFIWTENDDDDDDGDGDGGEDGSEGGGLKSSGVVSGGNTGEKIFRVYLNLC